MQQSLHAPTQSRPLDTRLDYVANCAEELYSTVYLQRPDLLSGLFFAVSRRRAQPRANMFILHCYNAARERIGIMNLSLIWTGRFLVIPCLIGSQRTVSTTYPFQASSAFASCLKSSSVPYTTEMLALFISAFIVDDVSPCPRHLSSARRQLGSRADPHGAS